MSVGKKSIRKKIAAYRRPSHEAGASLAEPDHSATLGNPVLPPLRGVLRRDGEALGRQSESFALILRPVLKQHSGRPGIGGSAATSEPDYSRNVV
jgi:hypothetical protein